MRRLRIFLLEDKKNVIDVNFWISLPAVIIMMVQITAILINRNWWHKFMIYSFLKCVYHTHSDKGCRQLFISSTVSAQGPIQTCSYSSRRFFFFMHIYSSETKIFSIPNLFVGLCCNEFGLHFLELVNYNNVHYIKGFNGFIWSLNMLRICFLVPWHKSQFPMWIFYALISIKTHGWLAVCQSCD